MRWDGGPLEIAHRAKDKALSDAETRDVIARWYEPATLALLEGSPANCLLLTFSGGSDASVEKKQQELVKAYAQQARKRGLAALGLVYPGAAAAGALARAAADAGLDGLVLEGKFPAELDFAAEVQKALRSLGSAAVVIPVAPSAAPLRKSNWPVAAVEGVTPGVNKASETTTASATAGLWVDSNIWLVRSFRLEAAPRPVWISYRIESGSPGLYTKSIADAATAGGRWIVALEDGLRAKLLKGDAAAKAAWKGIGGSLAFFAERTAWRNSIPFGTVGIILDNAGPHLDNSEEFLNLVARRQIPYRVIDRARLSADSVAGLRAVLAFDLVPPTDGERKVMRDFAAGGGLVLCGPAWGAAPKEQSYAVAAVEQGEMAVYKEEAPDPESVARDLNDLLTSDDFGVSVFDAPSVLSYVSTDNPGGRMLIQMVNYADAPADTITIWVMRKVAAARLEVPNSTTIDLPVRRRGGRSEIVVPQLEIYGALTVE